MRIVRTQWGRMDPIDRALSGVMTASVLLLAIGAVGMALKSRPPWGKISIGIGAGALVLSLSGCCSKARAQLADQQGTHEILRETTALKDETIQLQAESMQYVRETMGLRDETAEARMQTAQLLADRRLAGVQIQSMADQLQAAQFVAEVLPEQGQPAQVVHAGT